MCWVNEIKPVQFPSVSLAIMNDNMKNESWHWSRQSETMPIDLRLYELNTEEESGNPPACFHHTVEKRLGLVYELHNVRHSPNLSS